MDRAEAKILLEAYRPEDADDPAFAEALALTRTDSELAAWFGQMQRFDAILVSKFEEVPVPSDVRRRILAGQAREKIIPAAHLFRAWYVPASLAALILVGLFFLRAVSPAPATMDALAQRAVTFSGKMPALQFVCFNPSAVADWINRQPASRSVGLVMPPQDKSMSMKMIGSSVVRWDGHPVIMIALQNDKQMAMLYIMKGSAMPEMKDGATETMHKANWVVKAMKKNGELQLLAAEGTADPNFPMPF